MKKSQFAALYNDGMNGIYGPDKKTRYLYGPMGMVYLSMGVMTVMHPFAPSNDAGVAGAGQSSQNVQAYAQSAAALEARAKYTEVFKTVAANPLAAREIMNTQDPAVMAALQVRAQQSGTALAADKARFTQDILHDRNLSEEDAARVLKKNNIKAEAAFLRECQAASGETGDVAACTITAESHMRGQNMKTQFGGAAAGYLLFPLMAGFVRRRKKSNAEANTDKTAAPVAQKPTAPQKLKL